MAPVEMPSCANNNASSTVMGCPREGQGSALDPPGARRPWTGIPEGEAVAYGEGGSGGRRTKYLSPLRHRPPLACEDRKSTRLNSSHLVISYAVFCLKKKKQAK